MTILAEGKSRNVGLTLCIPEFAVVSQAHDDHASELRTALIERGCPLSLGRNPFCNDVTLRHGQQNTKLPWCDVSNRHCKTAISALAQVCKYPPWHGALLRCPNEPEAKSEVTDGHPSFFPRILFHTVSPSFIFPKSTQADCWRARDGVAHRNPSNLFDRLQ